MNYLPIYISIIFIATTLATVGLFYKAANNSKATLVILILWLILQALVGLSGFYTETYTMPPRMLLMVMPPFLFIIALFTTSKGRQFIDSLNLKTLTILHVIRIPVEIVLVMLFTNKVIPELMTFEGRNFDIISGLTSPVIFYFGFVKKVLGEKILLAWNFVCLLLLVNIVVNGILSAPSPFQKFAFEQPNIALLHFPFIWLPCCVVPLVLLSHLASIRQLFKLMKHHHNS